MQRDGGAVAEDGGTAAERGRLMGCSAVQSKSSAPHTLMKNQCSWQVGVYVLFKETHGEKATRCEISPTLLQLCCRPQVACFQHASQHRTAAPQSTPPAASCRCPSLHAHRRQLRLPSSPPLRERPLVAVSRRLAAVANGAGRTSCTQLAVLQAQRCAALGAVKARRAALAARALGGACAVI